MYHDVVEVHYDTTIAPVDHRKDILLKVGGRIYQPKLQALVTVGAILCDKPTKPFTFVHYWHIVVASF